MSKDVATTCVLRAVNASKYVCICMFVCTFAAGAPPRTPLESLQRSPNPLAGSGGGGEGKGGETKGREGKGGRGEGRDRIPKQLESLTRQETSSTVKTTVLYASACAVRFPAYVIPQRP